jgi:hypothetical protein
MKKARLISLLAGAQIIAVQLRDDFQSRQTVKRH